MPREPPVTSATRRESLRSSAPLFKLPMSFLSGYSPVNYASSSAIAATCSTVSHEYTRTSLSVRLTRPDSVLPGPTSINVSDLDPADMQACRPAHGMTHLVASTSMPSGGPPDRAPRHICQNRNEQRGRRVTGLQYMRQGHRPPRPYRGYEMHPTRDLHGAARQPLLLGRRGSAAHRRSGHNRLLGLL